MIGLIGQQHSTARAYIGLLTKCLMPCAHQTHDPSSDGEDLRCVEAARDQNQGGRSLLVRKVSDARTPKGMENAKSYMSHGPIYRLQLLDYVKRINQSMNVALN